MRACYSIVLLILATILPTLKEHQFIGASDTHSDFGARRGAKWDGMIRVWPVVFCEMSAIHTSFSALHVVSSDTFCTECLKA